MSLLKSQSKAVGWLVLFSFLACLSFSATPLRGEKAAGTEKETVTASSASGEELEPGMVEKENPAGQTVVKKKFPWLLLAAVGVVAVGVAVYFLFIKKPNYTLTVTVGAGVSGNPSSGSHIYKKGSTVAYDFTAQGGYHDLAVTLDGADVAASGTIIMDKDHELAASSMEGLHETFAAAASPGWVSYHSSNWSVTGGFYRCVTSTTNDWEYILFNKAWSSASYTVTVRMNRVTNVGAFGIFLGTTTNMASAFGYMFDLFNDGTFGIFRENGYGFAPFTAGPATIIKNWESNAAIHAGTNQWNVYKVVKANNNYTFYINDIAVSAFTDSTYDPRYLSIVMKNPGALTQFDIDYVYLDLGTSSSARPGVPAPLSSTPATYDVTLGPK